MPDSIHDYTSERMQQIYDSSRDEVILARSYLLQLRAQKQVAECHARIQLLENRQSMDTTIGSTSGPKAYLPKIPIPVFTGDLKKWTHFKDTFQLLVHNEAGLTNTEKFHYLLSAVKGEAATLLSSFSSEERSYTLAWNKLLQTYDNPRVLATFFIHRILDFESNHSRNELQNYEQFLTGVADNIHGYK
ncbi:uncharacterized protein [Halyomorpha halys]|uniref:uncharacterized protein n=1 Tax=Halyomorpha halys TaxID=286706 RepID=UPI0006D4E77E|nr:uncharacterized protein LOC106684115 [Halyomorpha halys]